MTLLWIVGAGLAGGVLSLMAAAAVSFSMLSSWVSRMVSFAVGVLLAVTFLHLLPEAFMQADSIEGLFAALLAGLLTFFLLEKAALWRHRHDADEHQAHDHAGRAGGLIVVGDGIHNFLDGILIAAAFLTDTQLGISTTLAVIAHEVPQEVGDFMVLLHSGYTRRKALVLNLLSSLMSVLGGVIGYFALDSLRSLVPYVLVLAAASFIYVAVADLIPDLHRKRDTRSTLTQIILIAAGIAAIVLVHTFIHQH